MARRTPLFRGLLRIDLRHSKTVVADGLIRNPQCPHHARIDFNVACAKSYDYCT